jgi:hypothetical protein
MTQGNAQGKEGWKESYTLKEWKQNKEALLKLALMMPKVFEQSIRIDHIPGFQLINSGIEYIGNEKVDPCKDYPQKHTKHSYINHETRIKKIFMDKGMPGIENYILEMQAYLEYQLKTYPEMYTIKPTNT